MNPFVEVHVHPAPERLPTDPDSIETITVRAPTRDRGLVIHVSIATLGAMRSPTCW